MLKKYHTKSLILILLMFSSFTQLSIAQCPFPPTGFPFPPGPYPSAPAPGLSAYMETCNFPNEYVTVENVVAGDQYTVVYQNGSGNYAIVYDNAFNVVVAGFGTVAFTAPYSGTYYSSSFIMPGCGADFSCNASLWSNVTPLPPPPNDLPCDAIEIEPESICNYATFTNQYATAAPGVPIPGCAGYLGGDVWFSLTVPSSGSVLIDTEPGVIVDGGMAVYSGTCGALTLIECDDDDSQNGPMPSIFLDNQTPGSQIFIRVWEVGNNNNGTFGICATEVSACGNPTTNDFCESPITLEQGPDNYSSSTVASYTSDTPGNLEATFCGSIENNAWFDFIALDTVETFNFVMVGNCIANTGIQAAVYEVITDPNGCCDSLSIKSNCYSPGTTASGTVTATSLTVNSRYILVVDGFTGDACDFTILNWLEILPVELSNLHGLALSERNAIRWETISETNNNYFSVLRSYDAINFEPIGKINGAGSSQEQNYYQFDDFDIRSGLVYYRLKQVDFDGQYELSEVIALDRKSSTQGLITAYPNPTTDIIVTEVNGAKGSNGVISITDMNGTIVQQKTVYTQGIKKHQFDLGEYAPGMYFVRYQDDNSDQTIKIIKQ